MDKDELNFWLSFMCQRNDMYKKMVRLVFWLNESDLISLVQNSPDFWENRYRVVDLTHGHWDEQHGVNGPASQAVPGYEAEDMTIALAQEVRELLDDGILAWQQADFHCACQYLQNAADLADVVQNSQLQVECQQALAHTHTDLENYGLAIIAYQKILELSPESNLSGNNLGNLYLQLGDLSMALDVFQRAVEIDQNDSASWEGMARVYYKNGLIEKAVSCYQRAINLVPDFADAWDGLGIIFEERNELESAINAYRKVIGKEPTRILTWLRLANIHVRQDRRAETIAILVKAAEFHPTEIRIWLDLGNLYLDTGDSLAAVDSFTKALVINPRHGLAYCKLAEAQNKAGNISDAINCYELGISFIDDGQQRAATWQNLLALKAEQNNSRGQDLPIEAEPCLESVVAEKTDQPDSTNVQQLAASVVLEQPEKKILSPAEWNEVGNSHFAMGNYDQAIQAYTAAIESSSGKCWPYIQNLATASLYKGKMDDKDRSDIEDSMVTDDDQPVENETVQVFEAPVQQQLDRNLPQPVLIKDKPAGGMSTGSEELLKKSGRRAGHLDANQLESAKYSCPSPVRNSKDWGIYQEYSDQILSSWTQNERNKLLMDAFLEQPRAERPQFKKAHKMGVSDAGIPAKLATDVKYEKSTFAFNKKPSPVASISKPSAEDEKSAQVRIRQGDFLVKKGDYEGAAIAFAMAINLAPGIGSTYNSLGLVYFHQEKYKDALSQFIISIGLINDVQGKAATWNYLGDTYRRLQDEAHALQAYQKAAELTNYASPLKWRARNLLVHNCQ
jgi:tetratricopeptide (TPR) repeat protein